MNPALNLVRLYTWHGSIWVSSADLSNQSRTFLSIYTSRGHRLCDILEGARKLKSRPSGTIVHRNNLYATQAIATAAHERVHASIRQYVCAPNRNGKNTVALQESLGTPDDSHGR